MTREELLVSLRTWFQKFRATVWFRITYLVLLGIIVAELHVLALSSIACLVILLMPVSTFVVPYWLGERKPRRFAVNGLVVFSVAILLAAAMSTQALLTQKDAIPLRSLPEFQTSKMILSNGTVTPYHAPPSTTFTFRVRLTTTVNGTPDAFPVYLNLSILRGLSFSPLSANQMTPRLGNDSANNTKAGTWYETRVNLSDAIYGYGFSVRDQGGNWTFSNADLGPVIASGWTLYGFFVFAVAFAYGVILVALLFYFAILFLWWYTSRTREARAKATSRMAETSKAVPKEGTKESPKASSDSPLTFGGKAAKATAFTCTNCGADVEETDAKCPKCGAVFED